MTPSDTVSGQPNLAYAQVGKALTRTDAPGKAMGKTPYAGDYVLPGMLHAKVVRAELASARLVSLDVAQARALPGVVCVLTAEDMPERTIATDIPGQTGRARLKTDQQILVRERVRYYGEPLALIAAETADIAEQARRLIRATLEPIPGVYDPEAAMKPGAPLVQGSDNIVATHKIRKGDVEAGFAEAEVIVENTYRTPFQEHAFLEPEVGLAWIDENDVITIRVCTQVIEHFRAVADAVGVPHNKLRVIGAMVGGGFGGKEDVTVETYLAILAQKTRKPVRLEFSREDSFLGHGKRHPFRLKYRTGVTRAGKITALDVQIVADAGAYVYLSPYVLLYGAVNAPGPYRIDNLNVFAQAVATNNMFTSAFRGFGGIQAAAAYEQQMDEVAKAIGMDPIAFRRQNFLQTGDPISTGFVPPSAIWTEKCVDLAWQALGEPSVGKGPVRIGRGVAAYQQSYGRLTFLHDTSECWVGIEMDGSVTVRSGVTDIGAGQASSLAQIAAEIIGVTLPDVTVYNADSQVTPLAGTTTASRALYMTGNAARVAAEAVRDRLVAVAADLLKVAPGQIRLACNRAFVVDDAERGLGIAELVKVCGARGVHRSELAIFRAPFTDVLDPETGQGQAHPDYTYGAMAVEVAVDSETGEVRILKCIAAHDVGQCINRAAVEGQIHGGIQNGLGYALCEEMIYHEGKLMTPSFSEYLTLTAMDMPPVETILLESHSGIGPFGAKGIGEPAMTPAAPAVANAIADAIGTRVFEMPITPERIVRALNAARA